MQALHLYALEPIAEITADKNSYGFRPKRSTADAIEQCFKLLAQKSSAQWILEADIKSCFDQINHQWLLSNTPIDKMILEQWLTAGYIEKQAWVPTQEGTPQGGIISPTLANIALDGLEELIKNVSSKGDKTHLVRYADDFIVTGSSKGLLENKIKPAIENFLKERGLALSQEKTKITPITEGFNFLGFNIRKYRDGKKLLIKPTKGNVVTFLREIRRTIKENTAANAESLIRQLNPKLRGWSYYYRHVVSKEVFSMIDHRIYKALYNWMRRRHPHKSWEWRRKKYFRNKGLRNWIFTTKVYQKTGKLDKLDLFKLGYLAIIRHRKVKAEATPYDPTYKAYFEKRKITRTKCPPYHWAKLNGSYETRLRETY
jgi:RNA-directed DNA polymerase